MARGRKKLLTDVAFTTLWNACGDKQNIIEALKEDEGFQDKTKTQINAYISVRASMLRQNGYELKLFKRGRKTIKSMKKGEDSNDNQKQ